MPTVESPAVTAFPRNIDRSFDYTRHVLLAIEFGPNPSRLTGMPDSYAVFKRLSMSELVGLLGAAPKAPQPAQNGPDFERVLGEHMGYWEHRVRAGQDCFVHYAIGESAAIARLHDRVRSQPSGWALLGSYHLEPQSSSYPFGFPTAPVPDHWHLGEAMRFTNNSVFWFNFFPAQPYLFEKTFAVWTRFCSAQLKERGECNQLVAVDDGEPLWANGVDEFVQVNLNRFSSLAGFVSSARGAGESTFTADPDYRWYGMLLRKL